MGYTIFLGLKITFRFHYFQCDLCWVNVITAFSVKEGLATLTHSTAGGADGKESACNAGDPGSIPGLGRSPGERNGNPLQCSYLENPRDGGAWWAAVHGVAQSRTRLKRLSSSSRTLFISSCASLMASPVKRLPAMRETRVRFLGRESPLEKEMAIHSSTLAWKIPWTEEPDRIQSMGSQRVGHD